MSAPSKKSFSRVSSPIFACSVFTSIGGAAAFDSPPNAFAALAINGSFHCAIWLACTSKRLLSSANVASPFTAASATFALNAGEWFRRVRLLIVCSSKHEAYHRLRKQRVHLSGCADFRGQLSSVPRARFPPRLSPTIVGLERSSQTGTRRLSFLTSIP